MASYSRPVVAMFNRIAARYDLLNHLLSFGIDVVWRHAMVGRLNPHTHPKILDLATGTGDVARMLVRRGHHVTGIDPAVDMLKLAHLKFKRKKGVIQFHPIAADGLALPCFDRAFDGATIAFGMRNIPDRRVAFSELSRVIKPGGILVVLEFTPSEGWFWKKIFHPYFKHVLPRIGRLISGDTEAYSYLFESVSQFETREELTQLIQNAGFPQVDSRSFSGGVATLFIGIRSSDLPVTPAA